MESVIITGKLLDPQQLWHNFVLMLKIIYFEYKKNSCITIIYLYIYRLTIIDPHSDLLPVGLISQLVEHCTEFFQAFLAATY